MPRMNLTEAEAAIINRKREEERFYHAGYQAAVKELTEFCYSSNAKNAGGPTANELYGKLEEMSK